MTLERRMQALLDLVEDDRRTRCDAIGAEAQARARAALAEAHREARARMREAFAEERRRAAERLAAARAKVATHRRHAEQRRGAALLEAGLARLPATLERHWRSAPARGAWIDAVVSRALEVLPHAAWRIAHPPGWSRAEQEALAARIAAVTGSAPAFAADERIAAGLRIASGGIVVDGTLAGVLADRSAVGARLLGVLEARGALTRPAAPAPLARHGVPANAA
jgi:hypothetical protein